MGATASIGVGVPQWQKSDSYNPPNEYANDETKQNLKERLLGFDYETHIVEAGEFNREVKDEFMKVVGVKGSRRSMNESVASEDESDGINSRRLAFEAFVGLATRLRNKDIYNFFTVVLSLLFLFYAVPGVIWSILQEMRLIHTRDWSERLAIELGDDISVWKPSFSSTVCIVVFDNKAYFAKTKYQHVSANDEGGPRIRADGEFLHTVNRLHVPIKEFVETHDKGDWRNEENSNAFTTTFSNDFSWFKGACWKHFFEIMIEGDNVLDHPCYDPGRAHDIIYDEPILDVSTAAYPDVTTVLDQIQSQFVDNGPCLKSVFVGGDQQSYDRMLNLIERYPNRYSWVIPIPGDFHFMGHAYFAMNRLWYDDLTGWAVHQTGFEKTVKADTEDMSYFAHYDRFYALMTVSIMIVFVSAFDVSTVSNPTVLMDLCKENKGAMVLCKFLYDCGLPLLHTRMAIRSNSGTAIDDMWRYMAAIFRCTGKYHYSRLSVLSQHVTSHLKDPLKRIWEQYRTLSLRGNDGRNVGWDFVCERFNLECQEFLSTSITKERLLKGIPILNGLRHVRNQTLKAFGVTTDRSSEYTGVLSTDIDHLVRAIRNELGLTGVDDASVLISACSRGDLFRVPGASGYDRRLPWNIEREFRGAEMTRYVQETLESMPQSVRVRWA